MKATYLFWITVLALTTGAYESSAQSLRMDGHLTNTFYALEDSIQHTRVYETLRLDVGPAAHPNLSFHFIGRGLFDLAGDADSRLTDEQRYHAQRFSFEAKKLFKDRLDVEIGRQFLHPGLPLGGIDGVDLTARLHPKLVVQLYGGVETQHDKSFNVYSTDDAGVFGSAVTFSRCSVSKIQAVYLKKNRDGSAQWEIAGLNITDRTFKNLFLKAQAHYDLLESRFHRFYFTGNYTPEGRYALGFNFKSQYPQIYDDSYFKRFEVERYQQFGFSGSFDLTDALALETVYRLIELDNGSGNIFTLNMSNAHGSVGVSLESGDLGKQTNWVFDYGYEVVPNLLLSVNVDYSRYRFEEIYEFENQMANALRLSYRLNKYVRADVEYQWLQNDKKDSDQRFLSHLHLVW